MLLPSFIIDSSKQQSGGAAQKRGNRNKKSSRYSLYLLNDAIYIIKTVVLCASTCSYSPNGDETEIRGNEKERHRIEYNTRRKKNRWNYYEYLFDGMLLMLRPFCSHIHLLVYIKQKNCLFFSLFFFAYSLSMFVG